MNFVQAVEKMLKGEVICFQRNDQRRKLRIKDNVLQINEAGWNWTAVLTNDNFIVPCAVVEKREFLSEADVRKNINDLREKSRKLLNEADDLERSL